MTGEKIHIVIPVYNEGENIGKTLREIGEKVSTPATIYIVYDFDEDNTIPAIRRHMAENPGLRLVKNRYGKGVLNAIKTGFDAVSEGIVLVMMADLSDDLSRVDEMADRMYQGYDLVCGSRYMKGGRQIGGPPLKKIMSRIAGVSLHYLIGIPTHDVTNSFKMYSKKLLDDIRIESTGGFELGMEIAVKAYLNGYRITEVPTTWTDRTSGESRFRLARWLPKYLYWYAFAVIHKFCSRRFPGPEAASSSTRT
ncbi:MAG: glycosyltransferase [Deltaproteobacteria bacterium]|nr:glycosyltransferase [Deltaproteobacteria bacterium]